MSYDPNYFSGFNSTNSLQPVKKITTFGATFAGMRSPYGNALTQRQNISINRPFKLYQSAQRNPASVLTNNVTTLPAGNGSQFIGYGYTAGINGSVNINV